MNTNLTLTPNQTLKVFKVLFMKEIKHEPEIRENGIFIGSKTEKGRRWSLRQQPVATVMAGCCHLLKLGVSSAGR